MGNQIDVPVLSDEFPATIHEPNGLQPPSTALDNEALKTSKEYADRVRTKYRDVSPPLYRFIFELGEKCHPVLKGRSKTQARDNDLNTIQVDDAMLQSRFQNEESSEGDYLAVSLDEVRSNNLSWKELPRTTVTERLEEEEHPMKKWEKSRKEKPKITTLDDIKKYGKRNSKWHSGLREMVVKGRWGPLAELIHRDEQRLQKLYQKDPHAQQEMLQCILRLQQELFEEVYIDVDGEIHFIPTAKA
ncbi:MAG: hypothetical protein Q9188_006998 [Gyalolechia gomerana]